MLQTIGSIGGAFVGILLSLTLLWVSARALLPLALVGLPIGWVLDALAVLVFPALVRRLPLRLAAALQGLGMMQKWGHHMPFERC